MRETIYRTPRTYGSPSGYDCELSHAPNHVARLAEALLRDSINSGNRISVIQAFLAAEEFYAEAERRGHMLEVQDAPGMKQDYGTTRGKP